MKVLSLFDGISGCRQALKELNIDCEYYASEIDKYAIQIAKANHSDIIHIGDVKNIDFTKFKNIDLLSAGFPCQSYSIAGNRKGIEDERGQLIYDVFRALKDCKPKYFLLENVKGLLSIDKGETFKNILKYLADCGYIVNWKVINSALVTAQNRQRVYIIGSLEEKIEIEDPKDQEIYLKDIIEEGYVDRVKAYCIDANYHKGGNLKSYLEKGRRQLVFNKPVRIGHFNSEKAFTLRASQPNGIIYQTIKKSYQKRVNKISSEFNQYLKESRGSLTYKEIAINLNLPLTQVEHYFRTDKSRAIPSVDNYKKMKELLNLNNKWDSLVMDFETKQSTYEQNLRLYDINGKSPTLTLNCNVPIKIGHFNKGGQGDRIYSVNGKSVCLSANGGGRGEKTGLYDVDKIIRKLTPNECCRLQGFPDGYCDSVSKTQGYKGLGNSFTVPVIKHLIQSMIK